MKVKPFVEQVLAESPLSRDSDRHLIFLTLAKMWKITYLEAQNFIDKLKGCPQLEAITRLRRKLQAHNSYLSASPKVQKIRWTKAYLMKQTRGDVDYPLIYK